jgi:DNA polymerase elongation subunit (family B)
VGHLVTEKNVLKDKLGKTNPESPEYKDLEQRYAGFKSLVLSAWGVIGNRFFRRYDHRVAAMTTGCVRDLLFYVITELKAVGKEVIYYDTDSTFIMDNGENISEYLNSLIKKWALDRFNKEVSIRFDYEGHFKDIFILAKCRYRGHLDTGHGIKDEVKGVESKRKDSTIFMKKFQTAFFDKVLAFNTKETILAWIQEQINAIKTTPLTEIASPVKLSKKPEEYKTNNIVPRTLKDTPQLHKNVGDPFYIIAVEPEFYTEKKQVTKYWKEIPGKKAGTVKKEPLTIVKLKEILKTAKVQIEDIDVSLLADLGVKSETVTVDQKKARDMQAFDEDNQSHLSPINWERMIEKNILKKLVSPFKALGWTDELKKFGNIEEETEDEGNDD